WNFVNAYGVTINTHLMTGIIVAPGATVNINHNLNGTVVADIVTVNAESHRTDFSGSVTEPDEDVEENEYYVTVQKIQTGYVGTTLAGAEFDLYKWENNDWVKVNTEALVTGERGTVMLRNLEASVAYKLVETKAPTGYVMKDGAFFFWVRTDKNQSQPSQCPSGFSGIMVEVGGTFLAANDKDVIVETTSLSIKKMWLAADGSDLKDITVESINVNVYQIADGDEENKKLYKTLTLSSAVNWMETLEDLPLTGTSSDGTRIYYTYTVEEVAVDGYTSSYETKDGSVTITNTKDETSGDDYTLPETGGRGTNYYTTSGVLIMEAALMWLWVERYKDERRAE
ncbi:MAG: SpaA isopeptide-forming pilin-related protein, partial [Clostridiaceae bacterium]